VFPIIGSQVYFRHDDASFVHWSSKYDGNLVNVFSRNPDVNGTKGMPGMNYFRPFVYLTALVLIRTFGPQPNVLMTIAGAAMSLTLVVYMWIVRRGSTHSVSLISLLSVLFLYSEFLYQSFRLLVPIGYLSEMIAIAVALLALSRNRIRRTKILLSVFALLMYTYSSSRESSLILVPVVTVLWCLYSEYLSVRRLDRLRNWISALYFFLAFLLLFSFVLFNNGILTHWNSLNGLIERLLERFVFYWEVATEGFRLPLVLFSLGYISTRGFLKRVCNSHLDNFLRFIGVLLTQSLLVVGLLLRPVAPWSFLILSVLAIVSIPRVIIGIGWFWTGMVIYLIPNFYHKAYLFEAVLGLCFALGICANIIIIDIQLIVIKFISKSTKLIRTISLSLFIVVLLLILYYIMPNIFSFTHSKLNQITAFIDANKSTASLVQYLSEDLPSESIVLMISHSQHEMSAESWRHQDLLYRATSVRVLDVRDLQSMVWGLGSEVTITEYRQPDSLTQEKSMYGIAFSSTEVNSFENAWATTDLADFSTGEYFCKIFVINPL
jgi:hypothetical protein